MFHKDHDNPFLYVFFSVVHDDIFNISLFLTPLSSPLTDLLETGEYTLEQILRENELLQEVKSVHPQLIDFLAQYASVSTLIDYLVRVDSGTNETNNNNNISTSEDHGEDDGIEYASFIDAKKIVQHDGGEVKVDTDSNNYKNNQFGKTEEVDQNTMEIEQEDSDVRNPVNGCNGVKNLFTNATDYNNSPFMFIEEEKNIFNIESNDNDDDEEYLTLRRIRYPYMACEIVCCENPRILDILVHGKNDLSGISLLDQFFSILELSPDKLDDRHAGYFEKVCAITRCIPP